MLDFGLDQESVVNKVLLQSELLKDVLSELDPTSSNLKVFNNFEFIINSNIWSLVRIIHILQLLLSPKSPYFMLSTNGIAGDCHVQLPHNNELIEIFQCKKEAKSKYLLPHIKPAMKAMSCSNKVSLRTNEAGLLCFQYMIKTEDGVNCFIEYYVSTCQRSDDVFRKFQNLIVCC